MRKGIILAIMVTAAVAVASRPSAARDWYVDGANGSDANPGSAQLPLKNWATILQNPLLMPGDTVHLLPTMTYTDVALLASGTAAAPIVLSGDANVLTQLAGDGNNHALYVKANYVVIENFEILSAPGNFDAIAIDSSHHVSVTHNIACGAGISGIQADKSDYITISHNTACGNGFETARGIFGSGISIWESTDIDNNTGVKTIVDGNFSYANHGVPSGHDCRSNPAGDHCVDFDGNGIIIDDTEHLQTDRQAYRGTTRLTNNVVFDNGGAGIRAFTSDHAIISGNSTFHNLQDRYRSYFNLGEIDLFDSGALTVTNNIIFSDGATRSDGTLDPVSNYAIDVQCYYSTCGDGGPVSLARNLCYNDQNDARLQLYAFATNVLVSKRFPEIWADPRYLNSSIHPDRADFRVAEHSPALRRGRSEFDYLRRDILGVRRRAPITIGAYENPGG